MHWLRSMLAALGLDHTIDEILIGALIFWNKLPWWIAAMRVAIGKDPEKLKRARKALRGALEPRRRWPWQRSPLASRQPNQTIPVGERSYVSL